MRALPAQFYVDQDADQMNHTVLFVCEGNICRSPMAQGLLAARLPHIAVRSAGVSAIVGGDAHPLAVELMADRGIDISGHVGVALNRQDVCAAGLILVMTEVQRRTIERIYPFLKGKVYRVREHDGLDVTDPYRRGRAEFEASLTQIESGLRRWLDAIVQLFA
jgi:protein-tyrosine phosphatase